MLMFYKQKSKHHLGLISKAHTFNAGVYKWLNTELGNNQGWPSCGKQTVAWNSIWSRVSSEVVCGSKRYTLKSQCVLEGAVEVVCNNM